MRDILSSIVHWTEPFAVATVTETWSSAPRRPGSSMAVSSTGEVVGSVSGGCVESDLYLRCQEVIAGGDTQVVRYSVGDGDALSIGLTCGGRIDVVIQYIDPSLGWLAALHDAVLSRTPVALCTILDGDGAGQTRLVLRAESHGTTHVPHVDRELDRRALDTVSRDDGSIIDIACDWLDKPVHARAFVLSLTPPSRMVIFGSTDHAAAVCRIAKFMGYDVTVCDTRPVFTTPARFPDADEVVVEWPEDYLDQTVIDSQTAICILTHDPRFDIPLLEKSLATRARYIGAMGSRKVHKKRMEELRARGLTETELSRLHSPIGLDIGGYSPEEVAVAVAAELIAERHGGTGQSLSRVSTAERTGDVLARELETAVTQP
ncbi:XdhC family protein [Flaviflexus massiliensis]|uniref:XdhC family protein n=1 Tax=Flaviflexus massiliensis TaxID=1522309 RepID=UPI00097D7AE6|nr:XdhC/CoxI family protein [Flaviflexus massiliensis]